MMPAKHARNIYLIFFILFYFSASAHLQLNKLKQDKYWKKTFISHLLYFMLEVRTA